MKPKNNVKFSENQTHFILYFELFKWDSSVKRAILSAENGGCSWQRGQPLVASLSFDWNHLSTHSLPQK